MVGGEGNSRGPGKGLEPLNQLAGAVEQGLVETRAGHQFQGGEAGGHGHRVAR